MKAGLELSVKQEYWKGASEDANNLSELMLILGEVSQAVYYGERSVTYADLSKKDYQREGRRTTLANALHYSGRLEEAEKWFREAEAIQEKWKSDYYYIYSVWGFRFCDLLLNQGMYHEVIKRAEKTLEWEKKGGILLDIALDNLSLGHAWMKLEQKNGNNDFKYAMEFLNRAVSGLQEASRNDYLPRALFVRAECYRRQKQFSKVWDDLNEALEIAESGSMKLYIADYHLEAGKLCAAQGKQPDARKHFTTAKEMMEEMGYLRKLQEVTELLGSCS